MDNVIKYLSEKHDEILGTVKNTHEYSPELKEYKNCINWLNKIKELELMEMEKYRIIKLPYQATGGASNYRILNDCETERRNEWIELKLENELPDACWASRGDVLIIRK
jgi:hypothetical protein